MVHLPPITPSLPPLNAIAQLKERSRNRNKRPFFFSLMAFVLNQRGGGLCGCVRGGDSRPPSGLPEVGRSEANHRTAQTAVTGELCEKLSLLYGRFF